MFFFGARRVDQTGRDVTKYPRQPKNYNKTLHPTQKFVEEKEGRYEKARQQLDRAKIRPKKKTIQPKGRIQSLLFPDL